jgi:hypothetical protein
MYCSFRNCLLLFVVAGAVNCAAIKPSENPRPGKLDPPDVSTYCTFRGGLCGHEYQPVCALMRNESWKTYPNGCQACRDSAVFGYREGRCR